jgi:hypothetical protein
MRDNLNDKHPITSTSIVEAMYNFKRNQNEIKQEPVEPGDAP